jgi:hypothetical protein
MAMSEYLQLHGRAAAEPVELALAELGRTLRRAHGLAYGQKLFEIARTAVLQMTPAAADVLLSDSRRVEELVARLRGLKYTSSSAPLYGGSDAPVEPASAEELEKSPFASAVRHRVP